MLTTRPCASSSYNQAVAIPRHLQPEAIAVPPNLTSYSRPSGPRLTTRPSRSTESEVLQPEGIAAVLQIRVLQQAASRSLPIPRL
ncbi:hypothetical protein AVEN_138386-1 [Araneus ventricosus]|uniref:Uncharacterized protein n=1 Tax=Araneus ventricosus TaxID=182803 RepID=A0A4Y2SMM5_ARAVE|nr:hypothetical protein AVEN_138386-1 [Araneus ventricosus]